MSLNPVKLLRRSFSFRLNLWYASIFTLSACVLFFFLYLLFSVAIGHKDKEVIDGDTIIAFPNGCAYRRRLQRWRRAHWQRDSKTRASQRAVNSWAPRSLESLQESRSDDAFQ